MFTSEGGIDITNLPKSYACFPLESSNLIAEEIRILIKKRLKKKIIVVIVDTDKTYSYGNFHFTPRPQPLTGIHSGGGFGAPMPGEQRGDDDGGSTITVGSQPIDVGKGKGRGMPTREEFMKLHRSAPPGSVQRKPEPSSSGSSSGPAVPGRPPSSAAKRGKKKGKK